DLPVDAPPDAQLTPVRHTAVEVTDARSARASNRVQRSESICSAYDIMQQDWWGTRAGTRIILSASLTSILSRRPKRQSDPVPPEDWQESDDHWVLSQFPRRADAAPPATTAELLDRLSELVRWRPPPRCRLWPPRDADVARCPEKMQPVMTDAVNAMGGLKAPEVPKRLAQAEMAYVVWRDAVLLTLRTSPRSRGSTPRRYTEWLRARVWMPSLKRRLSCIDSSC